MDGERWSDQVPKLGNVSERRNMNVNSSWKSIEDVLASNCDPQQWETNEKDDKLLCEFAPATTLSNLEESGIQTRFANFFFLF